MRQDHIHKMIHLKRFVNWLNYNTPPALSSSGWRLFEKEYREEAPLRHFIMKDFPRKYIWPIKFRYRDISDWVRFRTYDRYHIIDTGLKPDYYDTDARMFHGCFNELKNYVEVEKSWHYRCWHSEENPLAWKYKLPFSYKWYREPELGIKSLEWESTLDDPNLPSHEQSPFQAVAAREILALYKWWIDRPNRADPDPVSYDNQGFMLGPLDEDFNRDAPDYVAYRKHRDDHEILEKQWDEEDDANFIRLIKVRRHLWS